MAVSWFQAAHGAIRHAPVIARRAKTSGLANERDKVRTPRRWCVRDAIIVTTRRHGVAHGTAARCSASDVWCPHSVDWAELMTDPVVPRGLREHRRHGAGHRRGQGPRVQLRHRRRRQRHLLHIGVTRAAHQLWLITTSEPSVLVPRALRDGGRMTVG
ncbi:MAG: hypothetical protein H0V17_23255 [Deltaproteobacteria bacterium]|nr:hypothetical protein [Deltaproteobacteria bacterium]